MAHPTRIADPHGWLGQLEHAQRHFGLAQLGFGPGRHHCSPCV